LACKSDFFFHSSPTDLAKNEIDILRKLGSYHHGIPLVATEEVLPPRIVLLSPFLKKLDFLTWDQVRQLAAALKYVHGKGHLHRDIRRDNVMHNDGKVYLVDFGFALPKGTRSSFRGALSTASDRILDLLVSMGATHEFEYEVEDDVQSFVKVRFASSFSFLLLLLLGPHLDFMLLFSFSFSGHCCWQTVYLFSNPNVARSLPTRDVEGVYDKLKAYWGKRPDVWKHALARRTMEEAQDALEAHFPK